MYSISRPRGFTRRRPAITAFINILRMTSPKMSSGWKPPLDVGSTLWIWKRVQECCLWTQRYAGWPTPGIGSTDRMLGGHGPFSARVGAAQTTFVMIATACCGTAISPMPGGNTRPKAPRIARYQLVSQRTSRRPRCSGRALRTVPT